MNNRRTKLTIDSAVQWALVRRVLCHWFYFMLLTAIALPVWVAIVCGDIVGSPNTHDVFGTNWARTTPVFFFFILAAPLIVYDVLKLSHRFVGPIYRLHKAIRDLAAGKEGPPVRLRKGDFWGDVIADFNALAEQVASLRKQETPSADREPAACDAPGAESCCEAALT